MRIMHVIPMMASGGAEVLTGNIAKQQKAEGHDVCIVALEAHHSSFDNYPGRDELLSHVPVYIAPARVRFSIWKKPVLETSTFDNIVNEFRPDVIHSHLYLAEIVSRAQLIVGIRYFTHCHDNMPQFNLCYKKKNIKRKITDYIETKWLIDNYRFFRNRFIAISSDTNRYFKAVLPPDLGNKISLLHNAIDVSRFSQRKRSEATNPLRLVTIGSLVEKKNHTFLIDVVDFLIKKGIECHLDILGQGHLENEIRDKINSLNLEKHITMRGTVSTVADYLNQCDIYVHPATYEPLGLVLLEAMASGAPVVCLDGKGNRDLVEDNKKGYLIENRSISEFAYKIILLSENPDIYSEMSAHAVDYSKNFDIKAYTVKLSAIYNQ